MTIDQQAFIHNVVNRTNTSQGRAKQYWVKLKFNLSSEQQWDVELEWGHYNLGEMSTDVFVHTIKEITKWY